MEGFTERGKKWKERKSSSVFLCWEGVQRISLKGGNWFFDVLGKERGWEIQREDPGFLF